MSFASEVKKELLDMSDLNDDLKKSMLFGMIVNSSELFLSTNKMRLVIKTTIPSLLRDVKPLLKKYFDIDSSLSYSDEQTLTKRRYYKLEIDHNLEKIVREFNLIPFNEIDIHHELLKGVERRQAFVRGLFVAKGSINNPRLQRYHFEISSQRLDIIELAKRFLNSKHIDCKTIERKNRYVLYIKKCEEISNALAYIGASSGVFYFEEQRIVRDYANMANRMTNCDIANEIKCAKKCDEQLEAINYLREKGLFNEMPLRLQTTAIFREEYPESSYDELSLYSENVYGKKLSKSGISHCFQALMNYYHEALKKEKSSQE